MHQTFDITRTSRKVLATFLENHSLEELNKIPDGFNNNLIWNIGHIIVVQQMIIYKLSGLPMMVSDEMVEKYKKGTKPETDATQAEVDEMQSLLFETINQTKADYNSKVFKTYQEFTTMVGFTIKNAEDAMSFNYYHEALHLGMMMSIRKFL
jgi:formate dehydrogenase maturation protein FdhE